MTNQEQLAELKHNLKKWNEWREKYPRERIDLTNAILWGADLNKADLNRADLSGADLNEADLNEADLSYANLSYADLTNANLSYADLSFANLTNANLTNAILWGANLNKADLSGANLSGANLTRANLTNANLWRTNLSGADLDEANLNEANLSFANLNLTNLTKANLTETNLSYTNLTETNLSGANLSRANLSRASLVETNMTQAILTQCRIYGIAAWKIDLEGAIQEDLIITRYDETAITIDNLEVAQFVYLLLNNAKIRQVIDTIAKKAVLILGRFTHERKKVLDALRDALRAHKYLPILFDFEKPSSRDLTETVLTLAHLSRFIIIDLTDPNSSPHEAASIIPQCKIPIQPIIEGTRKFYPMFNDFKIYSWVLKLYHYRDKEALITSLKEHIIEPAEQKAKELEKLKNSND